MPVWPQCAGGWGHGEGMLQHDLMHRYAAAVCSGALVLTGPIQWQSESQGRSNGARPLHGAGRVFESCSDRSLRLDLFGTNQICLEILWKDINLFWTFLSSVVVFPNPRPYDFYSYWPSYMCCFCSKRHGFSEALFQFDQVGRSAGNGFTEVSVQDAAREIFRVADELKWIDCSLEGNEWAKELGRPCSFLVLGGCLGQKVDRQKQRSIYTYIYIDMMSNIVY